MTLRRIDSVRSQSRALTVLLHLDSETSEYRARLVVDGRAHAPADYFTDCADDARRTAWAMLESAERAGQGRAYTFPEA